MKEKISITLSKGTISKIDSTVDNVFVRNRSQAVEHLINISVGENRTAVILCGGNEKKLEITSGIYQMTAQVNGKAIVEHALHKLRENGFTRILVVAREKLLTKIFEVIKDGSSYGVKVEYIEEDESKGSADSLRLVKGKVKTPFLVVYGDLLFNNINIEEIWNAHLRQQYIITIMMTTSKDPSSKGTLRVEGDKVLEFTQKPKISDTYLVFSPIFVCEPSFLDYRGESLETDIFPEIAKKGLLGGHLSSEREKHVHTVRDLR